MVIEKYQGKGLGSFQRKHNDLIAKEENVSKIWSTVSSLNPKSLHIQLKHGWKIIETRKNIKYGDQIYDEVKIMKIF